MRPKKTKPPATNMAVHPVVKLAWERMSKDRLTHEFVADKAGVGANTLRNWWQGRRSPKLQDVESVLSVLGLEITVKPRTVGKSG